MSAILNSLNAHNFLIFQPILMILVSKFMVYRYLSDKTYLLLGLRSPLRQNHSCIHCTLFGRHSHNVSVYLSLLLQIKTRHRRRLVSIFQGPVVRN